MTTPLVSVQSPELQSRLTQLRAKAADGTITLEELREAVRAMRQDRHAALDAQARSTKGTGKRGAKPPVDTQKLFGDLENL
jgi:hypothetical protein